MNVFQSEKKKAQTNTHSKPRMHALARLYSFINVGKLLRLILKEQRRNAALVMTPAQPYLALHNLPEVFGFPAEIHTHKKQKNNWHMEKKTCAQTRRK